MLRFFVTLAVCAMTLVIVRSEGIADHQLPPQRFDGWARLQQDVDATAIHQVWRQPLTGLPKDADGYLMVSYQVVDAGSSVQAADMAKQLLQREQFNEYVARGFSVTGTPWTPADTQSMLFSVRGLSQSSHKANAQRADIYVLAFARETQVVWLQVRQVCTAGELAVADKAMKNAAGKTLADELATYVVSLWTTPPVTAAPAIPDVPVTPAPETPPVTPAPTPTAAAPDTMSDPPTTVQTTTPATPTPAVPEAVQPPPVAPTPVVTAPAPTPPVPDDGSRWHTDDGFLSLQLPDGWKASTKYPYDVTGQQVAVRIFPWEPCASATARDAALTDFAATQREIALKDFTQDACSVDGATGAMVRYTNYAKQTTVAYLLAKSGRFWRVDITLLGENSALPDAVKQLMASLRLQ